MGKHNMVKLDQARSAFPALSESAECAQKLKTAMFDGVSEADMKAVMQGVVSKAKAGDLGATRLLMDVVSKAATPPAPVLPAPGSVNGRGRRGRLRRLVREQLIGDRIGKTVLGLAKLLREPDALVAEALEDMADAGELDFDSETSTYRLPQLVS